MTIPRIDLHNLGSGPGMNLGTSVDPVNTQKPGNSGKPGDPGAAGGSNAGDIAVAMVMMTASSRANSSGGHPDIVGAGGNPATSMAVYGTMAGGKM